MACLFVCKTHEPCPKVPTLLKKEKETAAPMDSCVVPHRSTNRAALWLTAQIGRDAVLSESYGRRQQGVLWSGHMQHAKVNK
jgi:hypothetical protein